MLYFVKSSGVYKLNQEGGLSFWSNPDLHRVGFF